MDDEFWNYFMNYKHCIYELLLFYMKFYVIFIRSNIDTIQISSIHRSWKITPRPHYSSPHSSKIGAFRNSEYYSSYLFVMLF